jgi:hypothetical protein
MPNMFARALRKAPESNGFFIADDMGGVDRDSGRRTMPPAQGNSAPVFVK